MTMHHENDSNHQGNNSEDPTTMRGAASKNSMAEIDDTSGQTEIFSREDEAKLTENLNLVYAYQNQDELNQRLQRFPSVDERVKLYMSNFFITIIVN